MIKYYLVDNPLTPDPVDQRAVVVHNNVRTHADLVKMILHRSNGLTESQIESVLKETTVAVKLFLEQGDCVETELFKAKPKIKGVFSSRNDTFDRTRHQIKLGVNLNPGLLKSVKDLEVEKVKAVKGGPELGVFMDVASGTQNDVITPGKMARILGEDLKYDDTDNNQGIFFINDNNEETKVSMVLDNLPKQLTFDIPEGLTSGIYRLQIRSNYRSKDIRVGDLEEQLTVA